MSEQYRQCTCNSEFAHGPWCMLHEPAPKATEPNSHLVENIRLCKHIAILESELAAAKAKIAELEDCTKVSKYMHEAETPEAENKRLREALEKIFEITMCNSSINGDIRGIAGAALYTIVSKNDGDGKNK